MPFRNVIVESPARISVSQKQLIIKTERENSLPLEDIASLLIENNQSVITAAAMSAIGRSGCVLYVCDEKHMPCAVLLPFSQNSRELAVIKAQMNIGEVLTKQLWQKIVQEKIRNQARCLAFSGKINAAEGLNNMADSVRSGDTGNVEAAAARRYFVALFGDKFARSNEDNINCALNYGYAVLRGCVARSLAAYGFLPALGLHHKNELNGFNLADDMIEPFRPVIDLLVTCFDPETELTKDKKNHLFNCLNLDVCQQGRHYSVSYAIERTVQSLLRSLETGKESLILPELLETAQHSYE